VVISFVRVSRSAGEAIRSGFDARRAEAAKFQVVHTDRRWATSPITWAMSA
jgi:hypothetical protein